MTAVQKPRISAQVALSLLEALQSIDRPGEVLDDEVLSRTMPRRLGLSTVIERQVQLYREYTRQGRKLGTDELAEFMRLVGKRPDSRKVFLAMGAGLAEAEGGFPGRLLPRRLRLALVRRSVRRGLERLFGRQVGGFLSGPFTLEVAASPLVQLDSSGDACEVVTGFCLHLLRKALGEDVHVVKRSCETRGDRSCRWTLETGQPVE